MKQRNHIVIFEIQYQFTAVFLFKLVLEAQLFK